MEGMEREMCGDARRTKRKGCPSREGPLDLAGKLCQGSPIGRALPVHVTAPVTTPKLVVLLKHLGWEILR
eukprot:scaffold435_cov342-Pavlova_lutheri.AAC.30